MARICCWDLEIHDPITNNGGWEAAKRGECGISALVISDSETGRFHIYGKDTLDEAVDHLNAADLCVGFNTQDFDELVLYGVTGRYIQSARYDILQEIWRALPMREKGWKLDQVAEHTLGLNKNSNGEFATSLVAQGRWSELFDYCLNDVHLTRQIYNHIVDMGELKGGTGKTPKTLAIPAPPFQEYA